MASLPPPDLVNPTTTTSDLIGWACEQPDEVKEDFANEVLSQALAQASQHKSASGNGCLLLSGFVTRCAKSESTPLKQWAFSTAVGTRLLNFYLQWNETDQSRSMKLVLEVLTLLVTQDADTDRAAELKLVMLDSLVAIVSGSTTKPMAKSAIKMLDHFLSKGVFSLPDIVGAYNRARGTACGPEDAEVWMSLMHDLFAWMKLDFVSLPAGHFVVLLYRMLLEAVSKGEIRCSFSPAVWHRWVVKAVQANPSLLGGFQNHIFAHLFKNHRPDGLNYLESVASGQSFARRGNGDVDTRAFLELTILKVGKRMGLVEEPGVGGKREDRAIAMDLEMLHPVISHPTPEIRSLALSLLIMSASTTKPFSPQSLEMLKANLAAYFADLDAKFRNDVVVLAKDIYFRLRASMLGLHKSIDKLKRNGNDEAALRGLEATLQEQREFLTWYLVFLRAELIPTASYQRHVTSLKVLLYILRMEVLPEKTWGTRDDRLFFEAFEETWSRALLDLLMDRFEDVRNFGSQALDVIFSDRRFVNFVPHHGHKQGPAMPVLRDFLARAEDLSTRTARADHGDGVARTAELLYKHSKSANQRLALLINLVTEVDRRILIAEADLGKAVIEAPVHGGFAGMCQVWQSVAEEHYSEEEKEQLMALCGTIVSCCKRVWNCVRDILCDDSPEGHLPQDLEEMEGLGTKELLSFSFRAVNDSSNLMRAIVLAGKVGSRQAPGLRPYPEILRDIGDLAFEQLATLRHRGALGTVAVTFVACCQLVSTIEGPCKDGERETLLDRWYKATLDRIWNIKSTTRRSAGVPAMVIGLLSANAARPSFDTIVDELVRIAQIAPSEEGGTSPQVHAHNCLRELFKSSIVTGLGNKAEKRLSQGLELAARSLKSEVWSIRNCGLLLLRSLVDCLFGTSENKAAIEAGWNGKATRIPYHKYTTLPGVLVGLLKSGQGSIAPGLQNTRGAESVFPALDIIRRAGPPDELRLELQGYITTYLDSPVWHVREMAARTLCSCVLHEKWFDVVEEILAGALANQGPGGYNRLHGAYLALKFVFEKVADVLPHEVRDKLERLKGLLRGVTLSWPASFGCPELLAAHLEMVNMVTLRELTDGLGGGASIDLVSDVLARIDPGVIIKRRDTSSLLRTQLAKLVAYRFLASDAAHSLLDVVVHAAAVDLNAASTILETVSLLSGVIEEPPPAGALCELYMQVCLGTDAVEPRVTALDNLGDVLRGMLPSSNTQGLPTWQSLTTLWIKLSGAALSPSLASAVVRSSGIVLAVIRRGDTRADSELRVDPWGRMMAEAGRDDRGFDTRLAAAQSLRDFFCNTPADMNPHGGLRPVFALYDALNDDDDEVRDAASAATAPILGQAHEPIEAASRLLDWLATTCGEEKALRREVSRRLVGDVGVSAADRLARALDTADVLFVVEEPNLFVDEVREAKRWAGVLSALPGGGWTDEEESMAGWCVEGVRELVRLARDRGEDGPLGWTTRPEVFAVCAAIIVTASTLVRLGRGGEGLEGALEELRTVGKEVKLSGLLLEMM